MASYYLMQEEPAVQEKRDIRTPIVVEQKAAEPDFDVLCVVGKKYIIFGPQSENPFEDQAKARVIITAKQNGYVQYCWAHQIDLTERALFTRSCREFTEAMNRRQK